ncbi:hypothetical protein AB1N83_004069 [Pleurotus pulmonarius]
MHPNIEAFQAGPFSYYSHRGWEKSGLLLDAQRTSYSANPVPTQPCGRRCQVPGNSWKTNVLRGVASKQRDTRILSMINMILRYTMPFVVYTDNFDTRGV